MYYFKYAVLAVLLIMASMGALQIGLLDPICLMYRTTATVVAPIFDMTIDSLPGMDPLWLDNLKFAPGVPSRIFVGSFLDRSVSCWCWSEPMSFVPRFFCRLLCPLGALLGVFSRFSLVRINRGRAQVHRLQHVSLPLRGRSRPACCCSCQRVFFLHELHRRLSRGRAPLSTMVGLDTKQVKLLPDISKRRMLFAGVVGALGYPFLKIHGTNTDANFSPDLIRPPGSVEESEFLEKCIKCDQCINSCPTNVLQPATWSEGGLEGLWTPVMNFNIAHCQLKCTLCSEVCPTGAIRKITVDEKLGKGEFVEQGPIVLGTAFFDMGRCLPHAMDIPCVVCEEVCPVSPKAIQTHDEEVKTSFNEMVVLNKPFIVPDLCIGCGICQAECPVRDDRAVYVTAVGESRSTERSLLLKNRSGSG